MVSSMVAFCCRNTCNSCWTDFSSDSTSFLRRNECSKSRITSVLPSGVCPEPTSALPIRSTVSDDDDVEGVGSILAECTISLLLGWSEASLLSLRTLLFLTVVSNVPINDDDDDDIDIPIVDDGKSKSNSTFELTGLLLLLLLLLILRRDIFFTLDGENTKLVVVVGLVADDVVPNVDGVRVVSNDVAGEKLDWDGENIAADSSILGSFDLGSTPSSGVRAPAILLLLLLLLGGDNKKLTLS